MTVSITAAQMRAVSVVPAVKASYCVELLLLLLLDSSSDSGLLSFVSSSFFVPLAIWHLCANCHQFSFVMRIVSVLTCPVLQFNNESRPPSAVEVSFLTHTHTNSWCFCINITSDLERSGTKFRSMAKAVSAVYSHEMRCISFDSPSCWLSQHVLTTCPRTRSVKQFHLSFFVILSKKYFLICWHHTVLPSYLALQS